MRDRLDFEMLPMYIFALSLVAMSITLLSTSYDRYKRTTEGSQAQEEPCASRTTNNRSLVNE